ncbi:acyl-CoA thioesterase [candidate division KSB1 bacterium]
MEVRVRYADTDTMGVVYHSNYFIWCEMARTELIRNLGYSYKEFENNGIALPVIEGRMFYKTPAVYDDVVLVRTKLVDLTKVKMKLSYNISNKKTGKLLAEGYTVHCYLNIKNGRPTRAPEKFINILQPVLEKQ